MVAHFKLQFVLFFFGVMEILLKKMKKVDKKSELFF